MPKFVIIDTQVCFMRLRYEIEADSEDEARKIFYESDIKPISDEILLPGVDVEEV